MDSIKNGTHTHTMGQTPFPDSLDPDEHVDI